MSTPTIATFYFDDDNEEKMAEHGLTARSVDQVLANEHVIVPNRKHRRGLWMIVGFDDGGTVITVPVEATHDPVIWRPITAWRSKVSERGLLE